MRLVELECGNKLMFTFLPYGETRTAAVCNAKWHHHHHHHHIIIIIAGEPLTGA